MLPKTAQGQTRYWGHVGSMSEFPENGHGWAFYEYTAFCNGPGDVSPSDRRVAELTLLSVVDAEAATLC
jgi:hypothetical protein